MVRSCSLEKAPLPGEKRCDAVFQAGGEERGVNGGAQQRGNARGRPPSGQQRGYSQPADLLSTWPQRASIREGAVGLKISYEP